MSPTDYPALWRASDASAASAQRKFFLLLRGQLALLALTGLLAAWAPTRAVDDHVVSAVVALLMFGALVVGLVLRLGKPDDAWFAARAFAENTKSAAWRFMVLTSAGKPQKEERDFLDELKQIRARFPRLDKQLGEHDQGGDEITSTMLAMRSKPLGERLQFYLTGRLDDQVEWYRTKAKDSATAEARWSTALLVIEAAAVVAAVLRILVTAEYNPSGALAAMSACVLAWSHAKRFSDLASTYSVACRDLNDLRARASHVNDDRRLIQFVDEVETAISREHRLWVERRSSA